MLCYQVEAILTRNSCFRNNKLRGSYSIDLFYKIWTNNGLNELSNYIHPPGSIYIHLILSLLVSNIAFKGHILYRCWIYLPFIKVCGLHLSCGELLIKISANSYKMFTPRIWCQENLLSFYIIRYMLLPKLPLPSFAFYLTETKWQFNIFGIKLAIYVTAGI